MIGSRVALHGARHKSHVISWAAWRHALAPAQAGGASPQLEGCPQAGQFGAGWFWFLIRQMRHLLVSSASVGSVTSGLNPAHSSTVVSLICP